MASVDTIIASSLSSSSSSSSSSSLSSTNNVRKKFDVFLSCRGSDTDHLFPAMVQEGIFPFRDDEKLEQGRFIAEGLLRAIEESKFAVVVLSINYVFSTWCLVELAKIVDCMETKNLIVLPIFYHVNPRDVLDQTGYFAEAFAMHEERFTDRTEDVNLWRVALRKVANISGWVLNYGFPESQLIHEFIESPSNQMPEDGSINFNLPPRFDDSPDEADDDAGETVQDYAADLPREAHVEPDDVADAPQEAHVVPDDVADAPQEALVVPDDVADVPQEAHVEPDDVADAPQEAHVEPDDVESLCILSDLEPQLIDECNEPLFNLCEPELQWIDEFIESPSNQMVQDGSTNWDSPPRFDATPEESDDPDEIVRDYVADLPLEAHVEPDDVADAPQEAHVERDDVADAPQEAHVVPYDVADAPQEAHEVGDHAANSQRLCPICDNAIGVAFCCGHQFCVECGYRVSTCPICRDRVHIRLRLY